MLIIGVRGKVTWRGEPTSHPCISCGRQQLRPVVIQRYSHVFWIPFCPLGKRAILECGQCGRALDASADPHVKPALRAARAAARTPRYTFFGLAALAVLMLFGTAWAKVDGWRESRWIADPAVGDFYVLDASDLLSESPPFNHVVARVERVTDRKVDVVFGTIGYGNPRGAERAIDEGSTAAPGYFATDTAPILRESLTGWFESGMISDVVRP